MYKRQFLHSNEKLSAQLWKRKGWSYESGNISEQRRRYALRTGPVSYTHLDVYKRQELYLVVEKEK